MMFAVIKNSGNRNIATYGGQICIFQTAKQAVNWFDEQHHTFKKDHEVMPCRIQTDIIFE